MKSLAALVFLAAVPVRAQNQPDKVQELERKLDALSQEVEQLKLGAAPQPQTGFDSALKRLSWGGYGELNGQFPSRRNQKADPSNLSKTFDLRRFVLLGEYRFDDRWSLNFEVEFEHAGSGEGTEDRGEVEVEQAYLNYRAYDWLIARGGHIIVPMGLVNLWHEPTSFHGVNRPTVETLIIPSTWHENGLGLAGKASIFEYQTYGVAGLKAVPQNAPPTVAGFQGTTAISEGRTEGAQSPAEDLAWTARLDARPVPGALVGGAVYLGKADQGLLPASVPVSLWDVHGSLDWRGAELRALYAQGRIGNADAVNAAQLANNAAFNDFAGSRFFGGYVQAAFNVLSLRETKQYLAPFFRYERLDTGDRVPSAFPSNPATSRVEYTAGLTYKPIPQIALKADQQWKKTEARTGVNQWDLGLGWSF